METDSLVKRNRHTAWPSSLDKWIQFLQGKWDTAPIRTFSKRGRDLSGTCPENADKWQKGPVPFLRKHTFRWSDYRRKRRNEATGTLSAYAGARSQRGLNASSLPRC